MGEKTTLEKLLVKPGYKFIILGAPSGYEETLGDLPMNVQVERQLSPDADIVQCFVTSLSQLEELLRQLRAAVKPNGLVWITYPKGTRGVKTNLNRDTIRQLASGHSMDAVAIFAVDEVWSALRLKKV